MQVLDITLDGVSIESDPTVYQRGKGIIVDSGTTDTYLPRSVATGFSNAWEKSTGSVRRTAVRYTLPYVELYCWACQSLIFRF